MQNSRSLKKAFDCYLLESHTSDNKIGRSRSPICLSRVWLQTELDDTKSYYQLIIKKLQFPRKEEYQPLFKQFHGISLASVPRPHLLRRAACWISQPSLSRFRRILIEFLLHLAPICHLENAKIFDIRVVMVFSPSEAHRLIERFLKFTFVNARPLWSTSVRLSSPQKIASSVAEWLCFVLVRVYLFPGGEDVCFCAGAFRATVWNHDRLWCSLDISCDEDSDLWLPALLSTSRARSRYHCNGRFCCVHYLCNGRLFWLSVRA